MGVLELKQVKSMPNAGTAYNRGSVVSLNSGGNPMTVQECKRIPNDTEDHIEVVWMDDYGAIHRDSLFVSMVRPFPNKAEQEIIDKGEGIPFAEVETEEYPRAEEFETGVDWEPPKPTKKTKQRIRRTK